MRAYFFGNMYLSSIQQGIQVGHVIGEMSVKYAVGYSDDPASPCGMFYDWAENHKTMILLNGGYGENLHELVTIFDSGVNPFAWAYFTESKEALDGALTSVGIILPSKIYDGARQIRQVNKMRRDSYERTQWEKDKILIVGTADGNANEIHYTNFEVALMEKLNTAGLAR